MSQNKTEISQSTKPAGAFFNGVLLGALVSAGAFFLLGTQEGKKSREKLLKKGKNVLKELEEAVDDLGEKKEELLEKGEEVKEKVQDKVGALQKQVKVQEKKIKETLHEVNKDLSQLKKGAVHEAAKIHKRFFNQKGKTLKK